VCEGCRKGEKRERVRGERDRRRVEDEEMEQEIEQIRKSSRSELCR
jgi:hypothetical protein